MNGSHEFVAPVNKLTNAIAIFPFENLSEDRSHDLFCRSFTSELITELSKFRQLAVIGQYSVNRLAEQRRDLEDALRELKADFHITGNFRSLGDRFRLNVQLHDSRTMQLVWANRFDGEWEGIFRTYDTLLSQLVAILQEWLNVRLVSGVPAKPTTDLTAYEAFLYGMEELKRGSLESDGKAREYFQLAIGKNPDYSYAYSGMSLTYFNEWSCQLWERWEVSKNGAYEWAAKAIELDEYNYIAAYVLGRVFLYEGSWESAEHYFRKSLRLNGNDPDYLIQNATCFVYLGHVEEAWQLYRKALLLNPLKADAYSHVGFLILVEMGKFAEALEASRLKTNPSWADYEAMVAGVHFLLGDEEGMRRHWKAFMDHYCRVIVEKERHNPQSAVTWLMQINPYRRTTVFEPFWKYISGESFQGLPDSEPESGVLPVTFASLLVHDDWCEIGWAGETFRLKSVKGFADIAKLVAVPGEPVHCAELMGAVLESGGEAVIDEQSKRAYKNRMAGLQEELEAAEQMQDYDKAERLRREYDELIDHLSQSLGLQGRVRTKNNTIDRARSAVTWRIRSAISRIEKQCPSLGRHLNNSVRTGVVCTYSPESPVDWAVN